MRSGVPLKKIPLNLSVYTAPRPKLTNRQLAWMIIVRIIFPVILLWDAFKFMMNYLLGGLVGRLVLQAQDNSPMSAGTRKYILHALNKDTKLSARYITVKTHDGARLDTLEINPKNDKSIEEQQYLIHFLGNAQEYESMVDNMAEEARTLGCNVIAFNHRNVGWSKGRPGSKEDRKVRSKYELVTDAIAQVQRLLDGGVDPENITLKGFSLGGAVATLTAKHFHDRGIKVNLFNDRSFSSLTNFLVGHVRKVDWFKLNGHQESLGKKILGWIVKPFIIFALALTKWEMNAASAYKALPATHKDYMLVRSPAKARKEEGYGISDDGIVTHYASLHAALKPERRAEKAKLDKAIKLLKTTKPGNSTETIEDNLKKAQQLQEERNQLKARKMMADGGSWNAHCDPEGSLKSRYNKQSGKEFFTDFFKRTQQHHQQARTEAASAALRPSAAA